MQCRSAVGAGNERSPDALSECVEPQLSEMSRRSAVGTGNERSACAGSECVEPLPSETSRRSVVGTGNERSLPATSECVEPVLSETSRRSVVGAGASEVAEPHIRGGRASVLGFPGVALVLRMPLAPLTVPEILLLELEREVSAGKSTLSCGLVNEAASFEPPIPSAAECRVGPGRPTG